jgi:hypothetical protein
MKNLNMIFVRWRSGLSNFLLDSGFRLNYLWVTQCFPARAKLFIVPTAVLTSSRAMFYCKKLQC